MDSEAPPPEQPQDEPEQVVGVLKMCDVCGEKTVHVAGVCRDHQIRRVRKKRPASAAPLARARAVAVAEPSTRTAGVPGAAPKKQKKPAPKPTSRLRLAIAVVLILGFVVTAGFFHVIHGGGTGVHVCAKSGWSLTDTVVDLDGYATVSSSVRNALDACKLAPAP